MSHSEHRNAEGVHIPSVSEIPGIFAMNMSGFEDWICRGLHSKEAPCCTKAKRDYYQEAANLGNDVHALREAFLKGQSFSEGVPEYQAKLFEPVAKFYKESGYKPLQIRYGIETTLQGVELEMTGNEFGGTLDGVGTFAVPFWKEQRKTFWDDSAASTLGPGVSDRWIEDLKIKSKIDPLHGLQLYGYSKLLKEVYGITADWGLIIRRNKDVDKRPELQLKGYYLPAYKELWEASMLCWKFLNGKGDMR